MKTHIQNALRGLGFLCFALLGQTSLATAQDGQQIEVIVACGMQNGNRVTGQGKLDNGHRVTIEITDGVDTKTITGEVSNGGTARAMCRSLQNSAAAQGLNVTYGDKNPRPPGSPPESPDEAMLRGSEQVLNLPPGWKVKPKTQPNGEKNPKVEKNTNRKAGKARWRGCSKNSHLSVIPIETKTSSAGGPTLLGLDCSRSEPFPTALFLQLTSTDPHGHATNFVFYQTFDAEVSTYEALAFLAAKLESMGYFVLLGGQELHDLIVILPENHKLGSASFSLEYGFDDFEGEYDDGEQTWIGVESQLQVY